jgi:pimeloyl-ACP methyl ester carboxylesterase
MTTFVLIHGAWHGGWCWDLVGRELKMRDHRAIAPDLPGLGDDRTPLKDVTIASWADHIANLVRQEREQVVLVGHSRGGVVISEVAERVPDAISSLVYVAAFLIPNGKSLHEMLALGEPREVARDAISMQPDGLSSVIPAHRVGSIFYNTTPPDLQARAANKLTPEPMMSFITPVQVSDARFGRVKRAYIECLQDNAIPIEIQRAMQKTLPCSPVITLDCDHSPFYSQPAALADALVTIASS